MNDKADYPQILEVIQEVPLPKAEKRKSSSPAKSTLRAAGRRER
jgi:hypothetical protein